jgi:protein subunit release factor A
MEYKLADVVFERADDAPYRYHIILHHLPTGMEIEQASEHSAQEARNFCIRELKWRLTHWEEYQRSAVCKNY